MTQCVANLAFAVSERLGAAGQTSITRPMSFSITKDGDRIVAGVQHHLVVSNRQELKQKVLDELEKGEKKFLIDFSQTGYIDSSGLGVLVSLSKKIRERGGELSLANLNADLKSLFELTRLDMLFRIVDGDDGPAERPAPRRPAPRAPRDETGEAEWLDSNSPA
jgi:anti-sigma B factor antagonist